nr:MAG TPA: Chromatin remodeling complex ATPase [Caudoviricetes sp.]
MAVQLYPHQQKTLEETEQFNKVGYFLDMGLGKTFVGSEKMIQLNKRVNLVICQKSKVNDWVQHFEKYYNLIVYDLTDKTDFKEFVNWDGSVMADIDYYRKRVGIINYELAFRRPELSKLEDFTLMLDESSMITNPTAKRTKFIHKLKPDNCILLSGTPTGGKYEKLWSQLKLLGWNISKDLFYRQYVVTEWIDDDSGFKRPVTTGYKNVDRLKSKLKQHGCIFMKTEEVFDLPEKIQIPVMVNNSKEFSRFMRNSIVELPDGTELIGDTALTKRLYARQLCGQYSKAKMAAFVDLVSSTDDRLIVFYNFTEELNLMKEAVALMDKPISIVNGETKDLTAYENSSDSVTFIQYQAGAMGLNLQKSNKIIYFTLPQSSELFEQSMKRIHRIGQSKNCFYYILMVKNSVEGVILETLKIRKDYDDELFKEYEETF